MWLLKSLKSMYLRLPQPDFTSYGCSILSNSPQGIWGETYRSLLMFHPCRGRFTPRDGDQTRQIMWFPFDNFFEHRVQWRFKILCIEVHPYIQVIFLHIYAYAYAHRTHGASDKIYYWKVILQLFYSCVLANRDLKTRRKLFCC